jgi:aminopeptidase
MAQMAEMSTEAFEDLYFNVCNLDYSKMSRAMDGLVDLMNRTDRVRIVGNGTDLSFSIKGLPAVKCDGHRNIPDGEVFTAPVKDSVNGRISYNTPSKYQGFTYENVTLEFKDGKIINAASNDTAKINKVFDTDEGARYVGEFSFGFNPYIVKR